MSLRRGEQLMLIRIGYLLLAALLFGQGAEGQMQRATAGGSSESKTHFSLSVSAVQGTVRVGEPVMVRVVLTNTTSHEISLWKENRVDQGGFVYKIAVREQQGHIPKDTKLGRDIKGRENPTYLNPDTPLNSSGAPIPLAPGQKLTDDLNVSNLYELNQPGKYSIQVQRFDDVSKTFVKSNTITISLVP